MHVSTWRANKTALVHGFTYSIKVQTQKFCRHVEVNLMDTAFKNVYSKPLWLSQKNEINLSTQSTLHDGAVFIGPPCKLATF